MDPETKRKIAALVTLADEVLAKGGRFPKLEDRVKQACAAMGISDDGEVTIDLKEIATEVDKLKAAQEAMIQRFQTLRTPYFVPGMHEEKQKFSVARAILAYRANNWDKAGFEAECLKAIREKSGSIVAGDDEQGGIFVSEQLIPDWITALFIKSEFVALNGDGQTRISLIPGLTGSPAKIPEFKAGLKAYWLDEADAHTKSKIKTAMRKLTPKKLGVLFSMTQEMIENAAALDPFLQANVTDLLSEEWDRTVLYGLGGDSQPLGVALTDGIQIYRAETRDVYTSLAAARAVSDWDGGELTPAKLEEMTVVMREKKIRPDASFHTAMSPRYELRLKTTRIEHYSSQPDDEKGYLLPPFLSEDALRSLIGPYFATNHIESNKLPGASIGGTTDSTEEKFTDVLRGNLSEIVGGMWGGIRFINDGGTGTDMVTEETNFLARIRVDHTVRRKEALVLCPDARAQAA